MLIIWKLFLQCEPVRILWDCVGDNDNVSFKVSAGASKELSSFFLFGKNLRLIGASVKDCVLLYKRTEAEVRMVHIVEDIGFTRRLADKNGKSPMVPFDTETSHETLPRVFGMKSKHLPH